MNIWGQRHEDDVITGGLKIGASPIFNPLRYDPIPHFSRTVDLSQLRQRIVASFDEEELRTLYFEAGVHYDEVPGQGTAAKVRGI